MNESDNKGYASFLMVYRQYSRIVSSLNNFKTIKSTLFLNFHVTLCT
jgi:hypothetical protein